MTTVDLNMPQMLNLYNYCGNDPINHTDANGLSWFSSFFKAFKKVLNFVANIVKIVAYIVAIVLLIVALGPVLGVIVSVAITVLPHIVGIVAKTIYRSIKQSIRENGLSFGSFFKGLFRGIKQAAGFLKSIFTRKFLDFIVPVYGYFCGPGYGIDGATVNQTPFDELDSACREHDRRLREIDDLFEAGQISKKERTKLRRKADLRLARKAIFSGNRATGSYLLFLELIFLIRGNFG